MNYPHPYTRCLGGRGQIYLNDCLIPLAARFGDAEFTFNDLDILLSDASLSPRKMFSQMKEAGFIVKLPGDPKNSRYILHPDVFHIITERGIMPSQDTGLLDQKSRVSVCAQ